VLTNFGDNFFLKIQYDRRQQQSLGYHMTAPRAGALSCAVM
jgi:hypothetical protein